MDVILAKDVFLTIIDASKQSHPKEMMFLLSGKITKHKIHVESLLYQHTSSDSQSVFTWIDQTAVSNLVGSVHSHPIPSSKPSIADKEFFSKHPGVHFIISYPYSKKTIACFSSSLNRINFTLSE